MRTVVPSPTQVTAFGGLNLRDDPQDIGFGGAVDMLDCDIGLGGTLGSRRGSVTFNTSALANTSWSYLTSFTFGGVSYLLAFTRIDTGTKSIKVNNVSTATGVVGTAHSVNVLTGTAFTGSVGSVVSQGLSVSANTPTIWISMVDDGGAYAIASYDGTAMGSGGHGHPTYLGVTPWDSRLVEARFDTGASPDTPAVPSATVTDSFSTVFFSDPGDPVTFKTTSWVELDPGDGEKIVAVQSWRNLLFIFKQTKFFVFYGTGTLASGVEEFLYRKIDIGAHIYDGVGTGRLLNVAASGNEGVYFSTTNGIFVTSGDRPTLVSGTINSGVFTSDSNRSHRWISYPPTLSYAAGRLYARYTDGNSDIRTLVFRPDLNTWYLWSRPMMMVSDPAGTLSDITYGAENVSNAPTVLKFSQALGTDDGAGFTSSYLSGAVNLGSPHQKTIRGAKLWGTGAPTYGVREDYATTDALSRDAAVTLGTWPVDALGRHSASYQARLFQYKLSASAAWSLSSLTFNDYGN